MQTTEAPLPPISVAIPTYQREQVLLDTVHYLLALECPPGEILLLDQTTQHELATETELAQLADAGRITWVRLSVPSIPQAMNQGLVRARHDLVLFLDDDIRPDPDLIAAHARAHRQTPGVIVAGRVLQPWHAGQFDSVAARRFGFNSPQGRNVDEFMGGNFSLDRNSALALGGFDENFVRVAYRFEAEFALRWRRASRQIWYACDALIHHLKAADGGTRVFGDYLRTAVPAHSVGEYYFAIHARPPSWWRILYVRPFRAIATRHHLRRPWWIPVTLVAELGGFAWALVLAFRGPRFVRAAAERTGGGV
jgi:GT2 family glycosyltransferase